jgi:hypothetical protein
MSETKLDAFQGQGLALCFIAAFCFSISCGVWVEFVSFRLVIYPGVAP